MIMEIKLVLRYFAIETRLQNLKDISILAHLNHIEITNKMQPCTIIYYSNVY
jgi:hypothetical protein